MADKIAAENMATYLGYGSMAEFLEECWGDPDDDAQAWADELDNPIAGLARSQFEEDWTGYRLYLLHRESYGMDIAIIWDGEFLLILDNEFIVTGPFPDKQKRIESILSAMPDLDWQEIGNPQHTADALQQVGYTREV